MNPVAGLYLHIPFCRTICPFCSFAVVRNSESRHRTYLELIKKELSLLPIQETPGLSAVESIYLGGGTPSTLTRDEFAELMNWCDELTESRPVIHRSVEINPEDVDEILCETLRNQGITRYSLGVQSFDDANLALLNRGHTGRNSHDALDLLRQSGLEDFNIDLIFGYPGQSPESLQADLEKALSYNPKHISVYSLTIEPKTRWNRNPFWSDWICDHEDLIADMYRLIADSLTDSGFTHYEISNFCVPGYQSVQNMIYWKGRNYLGLGLGAHSYIHPHRWANHRRMVDYQSALVNNERAYKFKETIDLIKQRDEELMLALRLKEGLDLRHFEESYRIGAKDKWNRKIEVLKKKGLLKDVPNALIPTLEGFLLSDEISASLSACLD